MINSGINFPTALSPITVTSLARASADRPTSRLFDSSDCSVSLKGEVDALKLTERNGQLQVSLVVTSAIPSNCSRGKAGQLSRRRNKGDLMHDTAQYVVLECVDDMPPYPRYGFATSKHAEELDSNVRWLRTCASLELAAEIVSDLNGRKMPGHQNQPGSRDSLHARKNSTPG